MTGEQLRAGRAMLRLEQAELAERAGVSLKTIKRLESTSGGLNAHSVYSIKKALEMAGIEFLDSDNFRGRGEGVRLRSDPTAALRREIVEDVMRRLEVILQMAAEKDQDFFERPVKELVAIVQKEVLSGVRESIKGILRKED